MTFLLQTSSIESVVKAHLQKQTIAVI